MPQLNRVLILSSEPLIAALVGLLVETVGRNAVFAAPGEQPGEAVARLRPLAVVLVDCSMDAARSDLFFAVLARHGIGSIVFGSEHQARAIAEIAAARSLPWLTVPPTVDDLSRAIATAAGEAAVGRGEERRESPDAIVAADGTRILRDRTGHRWMVYDRRQSSDRRARDEPGDMTTRVFVSDEGRRLEYGVSPSEASQASALALETQLMRAL
jgi:hypothetical protein